MLPLEAQVLKYVRAQRLLKKNERAILLVSGGRDSMALLHIMCALKPFLDCTLHVLHLDHGIRTESQSDALWLKQHIHHIGLPFHLKTAPHLSANQAGLQAAARIWRQEQAEMLCNTLPADKIATAHQLDDQLETLLMQWFRGVHLMNWRGMEQDGRWIRPLLGIRRDVLAHYLRERGIGWRDDPSNQDLKYTRNAIRLEFLPTLPKLSRAQLEKRLLESAQQAAQLKEALQHYLPDLKTLPCSSTQAAPPHWILVKPLLDLPQVMQSMILNAFIQERLPGSIDYKHWQSILTQLSTNSGRWQIDLPKQRQLSRNKAHLWLRMKESISAQAI